MLDELPDVYRSVITLVDLHELDYTEAAEVLRVPIGTVKSRLTRARLQIQHRLNGVYDYRENLAGAETNLVV